ncbi:uncharacterized protein LOC129954192 [Eupeodes corollae]|uniref:uncharacterized protein LOC129954192 n=1 Tax=Eupeodes corollae TaxID=290404 RepID=UPI002492A455|nr:uncharacterized protein LOC129954192 [Eupeodes corollae]
MIEKFTYSVALIFLVFAELSLGESQFINLTQYPGEKCNSKCVKNQTRVCYFEWTLELYHAMGPACGKCEEGVVSDCFKPQCIVGDGYQKGVMSINRMIPGPALHICNGDLIIIDVKNLAHGSAAAIHWHGLHMVETPFMDGVPHATQCPIIFDSTFRYRFYATEPGTHFYHSHSGHHKLNGQYGALIIREPDEDNQNIYAYDYDLPEHYILISDWKHGYAENSFPGLPKGETYPDSYLINGLGTYVDKDTFKHYQVPVTIYYVKPGKRYRFNLINSVSLTDTVQLQIEKHNMTIIATDSNEVEGVTIDTLLSNSGERYDLVINTNHSEGDYWIRIRGGNTFQPQPLDSFALLRYVTDDSDRNKEQPPFPDYNSTYPIGYRLNHPKATCFDNDKEYCVADLTALEKDSNLATKTPDYKFVFSFSNHIFPVSEGFQPGKYRRFDNPEGDIIAEGIVNNISLIFPATPILTQYSEVDKSQFCARSHCPEKCDGEFTRECIHIIKVKTNSIVEMALHDEANVNGLDHPFHLHGYRFLVMGMTDNTKNLTEAIEYAGKSRKRRPVWKDTVSVPMNGVVVTRFRANNPGIWLLHCHYELHLTTGMGLFFQVGEPDEWVPTPKHFPRCRNYMPGVKKKHDDQ